MTQHERRKYKQNMQVFMSPDKVLIAARCRILGVGANTPAIIKYPFWQMAAQNSHATYACINHGEAIVPKEIEKQTICINQKIEKVLCK